MGGLGSGPLPKGTKPRRAVKRAKLPDGYPAEIEPVFQAIVKQIGRNLEPVELYGVADMAFYQWQKTAAMRQLITEGITMEDAAHSAESRKHPALTVYRQADMQFQRLAIQYGMTPAARARLMPPEAEETDQLEEFLSGKASG